MAADKLIKELIEQRRLMEPEVRHIPKTDLSKHRVLRSNGEVTIDGVYPEREQGIYMVRVRVPGGVLTLRQANALADLAAEYTNGEWHIDTRANIEFHGVTEAKLVAFVEAIETTGLTTRGACGDTVRNIVTGSETGSAGIARIQRVVDGLTRQFAGKPEFEILPRKFKVAFYAADDREPLHRINDLGFVEEVSCVSASGSAVDLGGSPGWVTCCSRTCRSAPSPGSLLRQSWSTTNTQTARIVRGRG